MQLLIVAATAQMIIGGYRDGKSVTANERAIAAARAGESLRFHRPLK